MPSAITMLGFRGNLFAMITSADNHRLHHWQDRGLNCFKIYRFNLFQIDSSGGVNPLTPPPIPNRNPKNRSW